MDSRWQDWVIGLTIALLLVGGVGALWGHSLRALVGLGSEGGEATQPLTP